jgi:folate-dependent phosphoribosylglycinamide formyltransferase PurN
LALIAYFFPTNGITLFDKTLRFPTLTEIMTHTVVEEIDPDKILKQWEINPTIENKENIDSKIDKSIQEHTITYLEKVLEKMESTFELPHGNLSYFDSF